LEENVTIEKAETYVSVHSSHHTPPGLLFGRFLIPLWCPAQARSRRSKPHPKRISLLSR